MKRMVCEMCNSTDLIKQDGLYVCQSCGTKYSVEEAKKLLGSVKIDKTEETEKLLILARRARDENNSENAEKYYSMVLQNDPNNWEASFFQVYYQAMQCKLMNISNAAYSVANNLDSTISLIADISDETEKAKALDNVIFYAHYIATMLSSAAISHYNQFSTVDGASVECSGRIVAAYSIHELLVKALKKYFSDNSDRVLSALKDQNAFISKNGKWFNANYRTTETNRLAAEIKQMDSSYEAPAVHSGGCYIATAVYGSYDCPEVWTLRRYRDYKLAESWYGRTFIRIYYTISPTLVKWFGQTTWFEKLWKNKLDQLVNDLQKKGFESTPYEDHDW